MRRPREATSSSSEGDIPSAYDLYAIQGDSAGAFKLFQRQQQLRQQKQQATEASNANEVKDSVTFASSYNSLLLSYISAPPNDYSFGGKLQTKVTQSKDDFLKMIEEMESVYERTVTEKKRDSRQLISSRKFLRNDFILSYNYMLIVHASGDIKKCAKLCSDKISAMIYQFNNSNESVISEAKLSDDVSMVAVRMAFLMFECILSMAVGKNSGLSAISFSIGVPPVDKTLDWLESLPIVNSGIAGASDNQNKDPQLKFLFNLYKARLALADLDGRTGKHIDSNVRSARKDMKTAMEIFQQKLRASFGSETASVVSSANSEENMSTSVGATTGVRQESVVLQKLNQSALSLKAHLEQMKGNTKKSLILCSEAVGAEEGPFTGSGYDAVHYNNLAVVYETVNKSHLALHALTKALRANSDSDNNGESLFHADGTVRPNITLSVLHNAGICALRAYNFQSSYECIATCVARSEVFYNRPLSWIRMGQACLGIWNSMKSVSRKKGQKFSAIQVDGETKGIVVDRAIFTDDTSIVHEDIEPVLGSPEDFDQVKRNPLFRALSCFDHVLQFESSISADALASARLSKAYVCLAFSNYKLALELSKLVLASTDTFNDVDDGTRRLYKRQQATARMYAAEATCALGDVEEGMRFLMVEDGTKDANHLDCLASDLAGVALVGSSSNNTTSKLRLAKAQAMVQSSASAINAVNGNQQTAKQLATSALEIADTYFSSTNQEYSFARRALLYTLLREGNTQKALSLLMSLDS